MKIQGIPASPGVVSGFAIRLTTGPDEIAVGGPVSTKEACTLTASPETVPPPVPKQRDLPSPKSAEGAHTFDAEMSGDSGALGTAHGSAMRANPSLECQGDSQGTLSPERCRSSTAPHNPPGLPSPPRPSPDQLSAVSSGQAPSSVRNRTIIVAPMMTARELLRIRQEGVVGVILEQCDWNSDTMLLARSLGIPLVCGLGATVRQIPNQMPVILDGTRGIVSLPDASESPSGDIEFPEEFSNQPDLPDPVVSVTRDGITIRTLLTLEYSQHVDPQLLSAADGIGLWRWDRPHWFNEAAGEFLATFRAVADRLHGQELQIALSMPRECSGSSWIQNQSGILPETSCDELDFRTHPPLEWLTAQVQTLLELAKDHPVTILLSEIDSLEDLEIALATLGALAGDMHPREFPFRLGLLLESPTAAASAHQWLPLVHSLTIDWDSLSRQMIDREHLPIQADPLARCLALPVLRLMLETTELARLHGTRLTLCGHLLGEPHWTAVALAIGFRRLSVTPWNLRSAQNTICQISERGLGELRHLIRANAPAGDIEVWLQQNMHR